MTADTIVTIDELFAVGATFTLLAWAYAYTFTVIQGLAPGSFAGSVNPHQVRSWLELLLLSFTNLTATGLSAVVPVRGYARSVVMLEQVTGVLYVAMLISRMVALSFARGIRRTLDRQHTP